MDSHDGWRLQPVAEPVSYFDAATGQWTSGSFETAMKSEHPAVVTSSDTTAAASSAFAAAAQHGSASTPARGPWIGMHGTERQSTSGPMLAASTAPPPYANADGGTPLAEDRDAAADGGYRQYMPTPQATPPPPATAVPAVDASILQHAVAAA